MYLDLEKRWPTLLAVMLLLITLPVHAHQEELRPLSTALPQTIKAERAQVPLTLTGDLPSVPTSMMTYRVRYPETDAHYRSHLATALALPEPMPQEASRYLSQSGEKMLEVWAETGAFWFQDRARLWQEKAPQHVPTSSAALPRAESFLRSWNLLPQNMLFEGTGHSEITVFEVASETQETYATDLHVNYRLTIDGIPVAGPGGRIKVYLGEGYRIIGLYWAGFETEAHKPYPLLSAQEALSTLEARGIATTVKAPTKATIADVNLVYYAGPGVKHQEYLVPTYRIRGTVQGPAEHQAYTTYIPALPTRYLLDASGLDGTPPIPDQADRPRKPAWNR